ncbi:hypothetical protein [Paenibacillus hexagrammi]|uniref:Uncharacterized protein n=1 Tax=Paenibacillus hexagrammi TaxID=2908839 RepID=A0ABY3SBZ0_9BACL|nr:hypothetical protein [Paenibacillus sp. YPD9-1]UJF31522.1 hypothetical protein L0M14_17080 [Paenibacillus sp. YPD9-1]
MWKPMLHTDRMDIQMNTENQIMEIKLAAQDPSSPVSIQLNHAEVIEMIQAMLEINRNFRGDKAYFEPAPLNGPPESDTHL